MQREATLEDVRFKVKITSTLGWAGDDTAQRMMTMVIERAEILLKRHRWPVVRVEEFFPRADNLLGMNTNRGELIQLRLRPPVRKEEKSALIQKYNTMVTNMGPAAANNTAATIISGSNPSARPPPTNTASGTAVKKTPRLTAAASAVSVAKVTPRFYSFEHVMCTMLHEMVHCVISPHNASFWKRYHELVAECELLEVDMRRSTVIPARMSSGGGNDGNSFQNFPHQQHHPQQPQQPPLSRSTSGRVLGSGGGNPQINRSSGGGGSGRNSLFEGFGLAALSANSDSDGGATAAAAQPRLLGAKADRSGQHPLPLLSTASSSSPPLSVAEAVRQAALARFHSSSRTGSSSTAGGGNASNNEDAMNRIILNDGVNSSDGRGSAAGAAGMGMGSSLLLSDEDQARVAAMGRVSLLARVLYPEDEDEGEGGAMGGGGGCSQAPTYRYNSIGGGRCGSCFRPEQQQQQPFMPSPTQMDVPIPASPSSSALGGGETARPTQGLPSNWEDDEDDAGGHPPIGIVGQAEESELLLEDVFLREALIRSMTDIGGGGGATDASATMSSPTSPSASSSSSSFFAHLQPTFANDDDLLRLAIELSLREEQDMERTLYRQQQGVDGEGNPTLRMTTMLPPHRRQPQQSEEGTTQVSPPPPPPALGGLSLPPIAANHLPHSRHGPFPPHAGVGVGGGEGSSSHQYAVPHGLVKRSRSENATPPSPTVGATASGTVGGAAARTLLLPALPVAAPLLSFPPATGARHLPRAPQHPNTPRSAGALAIAQSNSAARIGIGIGESSPRSPTTQSQSAAPTTQMVSTPSGIALPPINRTTASNPLQASPPPPRSNNNGYGVPWACHMCTFVNSSSVAAICGVCLTRRCGDIGGRGTATAAADERAPSAGLLSAAAPSSSSPSSAPHHSWECHRCTFATNKATSHRCEVCGADKVMRL